MLREDYSGASPISVSKDKACCRRPFPVFPALRILLITSKHSCDVICHRPVSTKFLFEDATNVAFLPADQFRSPVLVIAILHEDDRSTAACEGQAVRGARYSLAQPAYSCVDHRGQPNPPLIRWSVQEIHRIATRLAQRKISPAHIIAWSLLGSGT